MLHTRQSTISAVVLEEIAIKPEGGGVGGEQHEAMCVVIHDLVDCWLDRRDVLPVKQKQSSKDKSRRMT